MFLKKKDILTSKKVILTSIIGNDKIYNWLRNFMNLNFISPTSNMKSLCEYIFDSSYSGLLATTLNHFVHGQNNI